MRNSRSNSCTFTIWYCTIYIVRYQFSAYHLIPSVGSAHVPLLANEVLYNIQNSTLVSVFLIHCVQAHTNNFVRVEHDAI